MVGLTSTGDFNDSLIRDRSKSVVSPTMFDIIAQEATGQAMRLAAHGVGGTPRGLFESKKETDTVVRSRIERVLSMCPNWLKESSSLPGDL